MDITPRKPTKILNLHEHKSKTQREIARTVSVNQSIVSRLFKQVKEIGTLSPKRTGMCGHKRKTQQKTLPGYCERIKKIQER